MSGIKRTLDKYLGVDKGSEKRKERLEQLPDYEVLELSTGGLFIIHTDGSHNRKFRSDNTVEAMKEMGVLDE